MGNFWKFQIISIPLIIISGVVIMLYDGRLFETWANTSAFLWNWLSCYFLAPALEKAFHNNQDDLWTKFKDFLRNVK